jgi:S-formylglutathione hydrolase FrmB
MRFSFFLVKLALVLCPLFDYVISDAPNFVSGCGLTLLSSTQLNTQLYEVVVSSQEVRGNQTIRILVPTDYATSGASRRYPVLYLLHGATDNATAWTVKGDAQSIIGEASLISVMPNGDPYGFYTNWVIPSPSEVPQDWRTYHMEQLVPWIDLNLRTVAKKGGRAICGLSMGGYGSIHYAERYSDNFIYATSFSGAVNILDVRLQDGILSHKTPDGKPFVGPFGYPNAPIDSNGWFAEDTLTRAAELRNISIALYTGNVGMPETLLRDGSYRLRDLLELFNIPYYFNDYGNGQSIGRGCDGTHSWPCWQATLIDVLPRMMAVLEQQH